jgi:hypothetical protein
MLQWIIKRLDSQKAEEFLKEMEQKYQKNRKENEVDIWFYSILIIIIYNYVFSFSLIVSKSGSYPLQHPWGAITSDVFPNTSIPLSSTIIHFPPLMSIQ